MTISAPYKDPELTAAPDILDRAAVLSTKFPAKTVLVYRDGKDAPISMGFQGLCRFSVMVKIYASYTNGKRS